MKLHTRFRLVRILLWEPERLSFRISSVFILYPRQLRTKYQNIGIATEIASASVAVVKLLILPVSGIVSTSDLYLTLFSKVGQC